MTLEAVADNGLYICHVFFGMPGCSNGITVFNTSTVSGKMISGTYLHSTNEKINGVHRHNPYVLAGGIYPKAPLYVRSFSQPSIETESYYAGR